MPFDPEQKRLWFRDREGVLFGFGVCFFMLLKIPILGVMAYGIAQASAAYLLTKIADPPPSPVHSEAYAQSQVKWTNKHKFLRLPLHDIWDTPKCSTRGETNEGSLEADDGLGKKFT